MQIGAASHFKGPEQPPLVEITIGEQLRRTAAEHGDRPAILEPSGATALTYAELWERAGTVAAALLDLGLEKGDRVAILAPNCIEWALAQFATARAGMILVTLNPAYRSTELAFTLKKSGSRALIISRSFKSSDYLAILTDCAGGPPPGTLPEPVETLIGIGEGWPEGVTPFGALLEEPSAAARARLAEIEPELDARDPINIQFTSGTTGLPKAVTLSHHNILNNGRFVAHRQSFTEQDRVCIPVPLYHCFGMVMGDLACIATGAAWVYPAPGFDPALTLEAVENCRATALYGVPTMFIAMLNDPSFEERDLGSLRTGIMAGSPCPVEIMKRVVSEMNMSEVTICYGMTETSPVSFQSEKHDSLDRRVSSVGSLHPHLEARVIGLDGEVAPIGVEGEIQVRGYSVMSGYWGDPEATKAAIIEGGWMRTGDLGTLDAEGFCKVTGRSKDIIIRGGENIAPKEIEDYLYTHPDVADVQVFGVADDKFGEAVCAWVQLKPNATADEASLKAYCQGKLAHFKIPRTIRVVQDFPLTASGKVQKFIMRRTEEQGEAG